MSISHGAATAQPVARLINELARLPGIGPKTASRLAYHMLRAPRDEAVSLAEAILDVKERVRLGASRGRQAEIRIGGNSIGWADREGLWKVAETPRYTSQYAKR